MMTSRFHSFLELRAKREIFKHRTSTATNKKKSKHSLIFDSTINLFTQKRNKIANNKNAYPKIFKIKKLILALLNSFLKPNKMK
jgi:hypothetical protein